MTSDEDRLTRLELRFMEQQDLLETLNAELTKAVGSLDAANKRVERLEQAMQEVLRLLQTPASEKPPHY
ncbi:MAG: SlyX family protein [Myxococcota bacterium]